MKCMVKIYRGKYFVKGNKLSKEALDEIIGNFSEFFREEIVQSHIENTVKLVRLKEFNLNPFLDIYKARFLTGKDDAKSIAKSLVYARALGTSINTIFGTRLQKYCSQILDGFGSTTQGIDIEFTDMLDGRRKYCQIKAGPNTINKDDVTTIINHFDGIRNLARTNDLNIGLNDLIVGVFYGTPDQLSNHYKTLNREYPVFVGKDFWHRLTGYADFYNILAKEMGNIALQYDGTELLDDVIGELSKEIEIFIKDFIKDSEEEKQRNKDSLGKIKELGEKYKVK